jgi:Fe-S-cluster-containing dehydrogenase component
MPSLGLPIYGQQQGSSVDTRRWRTTERASATDDPPARREFQPGDDVPPPSLTRRSFLQVLGASAALAGVACKPPREKLVPYVRPPASVTPSLPNTYATALERGGYAVGLVVTSWEGRPTKIEGNREHPASKGGTDAQLQAAILDLYDPGRLDGFVRDGRPLGRVALFREVAALAADHQKDGGARLRFLVEPASSPTLADLRRRLLEKLPNARFDAWTAVGGDAARAGHALAFGQPLDASWALADADVILSLEADLLAMDGEPLRQAREWAARRTGERLDRLYVAEAAHSVTGASADHRFRMKSSEVLGFARAVAGELAAKHGLADLAPLGAPAPGALGKVVAAVAKDLAGAKGRSLVTAGDRQPPPVHALAAAMNAALGNAGRTVTYRRTALLDPDAGPEGLKRLRGELDAGQVDTLVVTAWNPLHTAPADVDLRKAFGKAKHRVVLALRPDETVRAATWRLAKTHPLEAWGDTRARDGSTSIVQPLIAPLYESLTEAELLAAFLGDADRGAHALVRDGWRVRAADPAFDRRWEEWLAAGLAPSSAAPPVGGTPDLAKVVAALRAAPPSPVASPVLEASFVPDYKVLDGRFLENAWLQEFPDPITKLTWDNAAMISPDTAARLGLANGDEVELSLGGRKVRGWVQIVPGHADDAVTLPLGYGQEVAGAVGQGTGFDAYRLRQSGALSFAPGLQLAKTGGKHPLVTTQEHFDMHGREIALAVDAGKLHEEQEQLETLRGAPATIQRPIDYTQQDYRWGMAIDLSKCIGCGACTVACQAENNIPVVGKEAVARSREMHWLRVDRYFEGTAQDPQSVAQPLACVHCEMAPCEYVCPVNATVHSDEGLNEMVYNRCVGTRYCSNNCPYKVRRFNYLSYNDRLDEAPTLRMLMNPDVTVRGRGVMEKCTYCTQRIERARIGARSAGRKVGGDEVVSACAQACPAEAIVFGNLNDAASHVSRLHQDQRRYDLLHELGTRPRTAYLVKLRNPNPELA